MIDSSRKVVRELSLGKDFGEVAVIVNGVRVEISATGNVLAQPPTPVNNTAAKANPKVGAIMPVGHKNAGWIYAGVSETTHEPFYAAPKDSGLHKWNEAMAFAATKEARVPSDKELDQLFQAHKRGALKGTFNVSGSFPDSFYWSATDCGRWGEPMATHDLANCAWYQRFADGLRDYSHKGNNSSLRLVRD